MYKIFDIHTHVYPDVIADRAVTALGNFYEFDTMGRGTVRDLIDTSKEAGIMGFLMLGVATNARQVESVNDYLAEAVKIGESEGMTALAFGGMHQDYAEKEKEIERIISLGMKGIKIHPDIQGVNIDDERFFPMYDMMQGKLPVYFHMGDDRERYKFSTAARLKRILDLFPKLVVCAAHFGSYRATEEAEELLFGHDRVYYDTSSSFYTMSYERATELVKRAGAEKCMFGTDYPVVTGPEEFDRFMHMDITEKERERIFYGTAKEFLGL